MARINIELSLFADSRFLNLVASTGCRYRAMGMVMEAFILAQKFYLNTDSNRMIPIDEWNEREMPAALIEAGIAKIKDDKFVYVRGSSEQFKWLLQKQSAGIKRQAAYAERRPAAASGSNPLTLSPSLSPSQKEKYNSLGEIGEVQGKRVLESIQRFGPSEGEKIKAFLGPDLYGLVIKSGGFQPIREMKRDQWTLVNVVKQLKTGMGNA